MWRAGPGAGGGGKGRISVAARRRHARLSTGPLAAPSGRHLSRCASCANLCFADLQSVGETARGVAELQCRTRVNVGDLLLGMRGNDVAPAAKPCAAAMEAIRASQAAEADLECSRIHKIGEGGPQAGRGTRSHSSAALRALAPRTPNPDQASVAVSPATLQTFPRRLPSRLPRQRRTRRQTRSAFRCLRAGTRAQAGWACCHPGRHHCP